MAAPSASLSAAWVASELCSLARRAIAGTWACTHDMPRPGAANARKMHVYKNNEKPSQKQPVYELNAKNINDYFKKRILLLSNNNSF